MKFSDLGLHPRVMAGVEANKYVDCTPIQESAIPHILAGHDLAGLAQTGTGKTAAFVLPMMDRIVRSREAAAANQIESAVEPVDSAVNANTEKAWDQRTPIDQRPVFSNWRKKNFILVLVPTRELAEQVSTNVKSLGQNADISVVAIYGGASYEPQKDALRNGVDFIVATPGRLIDLYKDHLVDMHQVRAVIFDEADRMFDMGFKDDMKFILRRLPRERQLLVFSATLNFDVLTVAYEFGANPVEINVSRDQAKAENVEDEILHIGQDEKPQFLLSLLKKHQPKQAIIFSNFKRNVESISRFLSSNGMPAMGISSLMTQNQRLRIMNQFKTNSDQNILVATDLAARGLDIKGVDLVINFELPDDPENYVHRIGRTGRAGESGRAFSFVGDRDVEALQRIENYLDAKVKVAWLEDSDLVKDFAPFVRIPERDSKPFQKSSRSDGPRPQRHHRDGERGPRQGGGRRERRPGDRFEPRREGRRRDGRPHEGRPQDRQEHKRSEGQRFEGQQHGKPRHQGPRDQRRAEGHRGKQGHRHQSGLHRRPLPPSHRASPKSQSKSGLVSQVTGFFSGLFKKKKD